MGASRSGELSGQAGQTQSLMPHGASHRAPILAGWRRPAVWSAVTSDGSPARLRRSRDGSPMAARYAPNLMVSRARREPRCRIGQVRWRPDARHWPWGDGTPMELRENLPAVRAGISSKVMSHLQPATRKHLRRPAGCEGHLTRRQAAAVLGFASEFKVREFERQGLLHSVRGPMRTAFYSRPDVLALKARLAQSERTSPDEWTDADLIALLEYPTEVGRARTALDLVRETRISIERAERVHAFWAKGAGMSALHPPRAPHPLSSAQRPLSVTRGEAGSGAPHPPSSADLGEAVPPHPPSSARRPLSPGRFGSTTPANPPRGFAAPSPVARGEAGIGDRRGEDRLTRDSLIRGLRDPDPRARQQAFERLREGRDSTGD